MNILTLALLFVAAVLLSAVINQLVPRMSLPLIQIGLGVLVSLFASGNVVIELEPDLFLVLFIAPLLYIEAKHADKGGLWRNLKPILSLAIGLVVATMLIIGVVLHTMLPAVSLATAFALGAALGPTDAVAVTSLSKQVSIPKRQWNVLKGELLLNDASGIVSFQFAIAAAIYGSFSLVDAGATFLIEFFGGLIVGLLLSYGANWALRKIRDLGVDSTKFHVLFEICIPFIVYLVAQAFHVSGVIAVVVAGLVNVISPRTISPSIARMNIVSSSVWDVLSFALNGIVFVLLGTQLPTAMVYAWKSDTINNGALILYILVLTVTLMGVRFVWCACMELVHAKRTEHRKFSKSDVRNALITTFCGAKGTITLSILFTIPVFLSTGVRFPERNIIIFLGCGVILCTLLLATFLVPVLAPKQERKQNEIEARRNYYECLSDILRNVIEELSAQQTKRNRRATRIVIKAYQDRIKRTKVQMEGISPSDTVQGEKYFSDSEENVAKLHVQALNWEQERVITLMDNGSISKNLGYDFLGKLEKTEALVSHVHEPFTFKRMIAYAKGLFVRVRLAISRRVPGKSNEHAEKLRALQIESADYAIGILQNLLQEETYPTEDVSKVIMKYEINLASLKQSRPSISTSFRAVGESADIRRLAYQLELEQIQKMYETDRITRQDAKSMRDNVQLMQMDLDAD